VQRRYLPDERNAITHKFSIAGHDGYVTVGLYEDGKPGEIFIVMSKEGTVISGLLDAFATAISLALQYGVPLEALVKKFSHMRFEPAGITSNPQIRFAQSILDYVFRWMALKFLPADKQPTPPATVTDLAAKQADVTLPASTQGTTSTLEPSRQAFQGQVDAPPCPDCGAMMVRSGNCYKCFNCGATSGCS
jgi:ribonucleoside-diphosphate reductase alpha chain